MGREIFFYVADSEFPEVENARREDGVGLAFAQDLDRKSVV